MTQTTEKIHPFAIFVKGKKVGVVVAHTEWEAIDRYYSSAVMLGNSEVSRELLTAKKLK